MLEESKITSPEESPHAAPSGTLVIIGVLMVTIASLWGLLFALLLNRS